MTNAALEGNNSRVCAISQRAHSYRNSNNLMLKAELRLLVGGPGSRTLLETASYDLVNGGSCKAQDP